MERIKMYLPKIAIGIGIFGLGVICGGYIVHQHEFGKLGKYPVTFGVSSKKAADAYQAFFNAGNDGESVRTYIRTHISAYNPDAPREAISRAFDHLSNKPGRYYNLIVEKIDG